MYIGKVQIVRYVLPNGKRVAKGTPGAERQQSESRKFYAHFQSQGRRRKIPLSADRKLSLRMAKELEQNLWRLNVGLVDAYAEHRNCPIAQHVADYFADLKSKGRSKKHLESFSQTLNAILKAQQIATLNDFTTAKLDAFLQTLADRKRSPRTRNMYRTSALAFCNWLVNKKRLAENPLLNATKAESKKQRVRRALSVSELRKLISTTERRSPARALLYRLAVATGLRKNELKALQVHHLRLKHDQPHLLLPGQFAKNGKDALLPLPPWLVKALAKALKGKGESEGVVFVPVHILRRLKGDLRAAGIAYADAGGRVVDFHALRKCCGTLLASQGVHPKIAQQLLRHSSVELTMGVYTDASLLPLGEAVSKLPKL